MREIPLTQGQVALVDDDDCEELAKYSWHAIWYPESHTFYAVRNVLSGENGRRTISMHRQIVGATKGQQVDHRNHNGLDNQRTNLRVCTTRQNAQNMRRHSRGSSQYKGVQLCKVTGRWRARINNPREKHLGYFDSEREAAEAYNRAASEHFGEFALLNNTEEAS